MNYFFILLAINIILGISFTGLSNDINFITLINSSFLISMLYLSVGFLCFVWEKGFFDITIYSFNKIKKNFKKNALIDEEELSFEEFLQRENKFFLTKDLIRSGGLVSILCVLCSFLLI
ncbi:MAG: DUF3899 domain-containing protein [Peptostreptococcaceae bacterium]